MSQVAKLFSNGRSQAVRLPAAFRFDTKEVFIRQDPATGDVILSRKPSTWDDFFAALKGAEAPADFLDAQERNRGPMIATPSPRGANEAVHAGHQHGEPPAQGASDCCPTPGGRAHGISVLSAITEGELLFGLAKRPAARRLQIAVREFLRRVDVLPWDSTIAERYGTLRAGMEGQGKILAPLDLLIAAHALGLDAVLVTNDRAFGQIAGLTIEDWTA